MKLALSSAVGALALAGCVGPNPNLGTVDAAAVPAQESARAQAVEVHETQPPRSTIVGPVTAASCKNKLWDPDATEEAALDALKIKAAEAGATGLVGVSYSREGTSLWTNCWQVVIAKATAIR